MTKTNRNFYFHAADVPLWRAVDGDTLDVIADVGDGDRKHRRLRLRGIDTPESHSRNELEKAAGLAVRDWVQRWLDTIAAPATTVYVLSSVKPEKFGRWLGDVSADAVFLTSALMVAGLGRRYEGERKQEWTEEQLQAILIAAQGPRAN